MPLNWQIQDSVSYSDSRAMLLFTMPCAKADYSIRNTVALNENVDCKQVKSFKSQKWWDN